MFGAIGAGVGVGLWPRGCSGDGTQPDAAPDQTNMIWSSLKPSLFMPWLLR
jgi:hypothetical protein